MENETDNRPVGKLLLMITLFVIFQAASLVFADMDGGFHLMWTMGSILLLSAGILMYSSYCSHTKNVMKPVLGATLALILYNNMDDAMYYIENFKFLYGVTPAKAAFVVCVIAQTMMFVILILMNVTHYVINSTHHSSPGKVKLNKALYVLFIIAAFANCIACVFSSPALNKTISIFTGCIADFFLLSMVIIIESSLDEFRIKREAKAETEA